MNTKTLLTAFWNCGDDMIIQFAIMRAHLNAHERKVLTMMLDDCMTQETTAEKLDWSTRRVQSVWSSGAEKLLSIPWVLAYAKDLS